MSADSLTDENTGLRYVLARIGLSPPGDDSFQGMEIYPDEAKVMVEIGARSPLTTC